MGSLEDMQKEEKFVKKIKDNIKQSTDHLNNWRQEARKCYKFYGNEQWTQEAISELEEKGKAPITFNRVTRNVNAVTGIEQKNRQAVAYYPREPGDTAVNELLTGAADWVRQSCDAEDEESQAFQDAVICGLGWTETRLDYEQDPDGMIVIDRIDPLEMGYDNHASKANLDDARWLYRVKRFTEDEFKEIWGEKAEEVVRERIFEDHEEPHNATKAFEYENDHGDKQNDDRKYEVVQYQWYETEFFYRVISESGNIVELSEKKFNKLERKGYLDIERIRYVKQKRRRYKQAFLIGNKVLEKSDLPVNNFTFRAITGLPNRGRNQWFGVVSLMIDPQMWANKWMSQILYILQTNASGGTIFESGTFRNQQRAIHEWAKPNSMIEVNKNMLDKIAPKPAAGGYPEGLESLLQFAITGVQEVTGINAEMLGASDRNQPAYLEEQRKEAATGVLSPFFNSLRRYHKEQGRVLAEMITEYISDGRLARITTDEGAQYVPLLKDELTFKYDVIVDEAASSPNVKERVFAVLSQMIPQLIQLGIEVPPEVLDYFPLPSNLVEKWKQILRPPEPTPEEIQAQQQQEQQEQMLKEMMIQLQMQNLRAESEHKMSQAQLNTAKVNTERAKATSEEAKAYAEVTEANVDGKEEQIKQEQMLREQARKDVELLINSTRGNDDQRARQATNRRGNY